jgi:hypothetical protein
LGKAAYAGLVDQRDVAWGLQDIMIEGSKAWLLPNQAGETAVSALSGWLRPTGISRSLQQRQKKPSVRPFKSN